MERRGEFRGGERRLARARSLIKNESGPETELKQEDVCAMDGGLTITFFSVAMFVGSFLLGFFPLLFRLSEVSAGLSGRAALPSTNFTPFQRRRHAAEFHAPPAVSRVDQAACSSHQ